MSTLWDHPPRKDRSELKACALVEASMAEIQTQARYWQAAAKAANS